MNQSHFYIEMWEQDRQCMYNVTLKRVRAKHCCSGKATSITYPECVFVDLHIQHVMYMGRNFHLWHFRLYNISPHYSINFRSFEKKLLNVKCVSIFSTSLKNVSFEEVKRRFHKYA